MRMLDRLRFRPVVCKTANLIRLCTVCTSHIKTGWNYLFQYSVNTMRVSFEIFRPVNKYSSLQFVINCCYIFRLRMTFSARFELGSQPEIFGGWTRDIGFKGKTWERKIKCHEFTVKSVSFRIHPDKFYCEGSVKLVRGKYAEGKIYGPASSRSDKSLIYPCAHFKCSNAIHAVKIPLCARTQIMRYPLVEAVVSPLLSGIFLLI